MRRCALREGHGDVSGFFFFNDTATTEIYTLSLHDALPILGVVAEPAPAHALRNHVANVAIGAVTAQLDSEDALEPHLEPVAAVPGQPLVGGIDLRRVADGYVAPPLGPEPITQQGFDRGRRQEECFVALFGL